MKQTTLLLAALLLTHCALGQAGGRRILFHFVRPGLAVPSFDLTVEEDGTGSYVAQNTAPSASVNRYALASAAAETTTQSLAVNRLATARIVKLLQETDGLKACASPRKGIADTGVKTLTVHDPASPDLSCTYNYTESKPLTELTGLFENMASVLDLARKLESDHRFDRLALDRDMGLLTDSVKAGRAAGLSNIASTLASIAGDPEVLERVRTQASKLLEQSTLQP